MRVPMARSKAACAEQGLAVVPGMIESWGGDLVAANQRLGQLGELDRIEWAAQTFGVGLYALTSAGVDSALLLHHLQRFRQQSGIKIPVIHLNTGFQFSQTLAFRDELERRFDLTIHEFGPNQAQINELRRQRLWD